MRKPPRAVLAAVFGVLVLGALVAAVLVAPFSDEDRDPAGSAKRAPQGERGRSFLARMIPARPTPSKSGAAARTDPATARIVEGLTTEQKVAQLFAFGFPGQDLTAEIFTRLNELNIGAMVIERANVTDPSQVAALAGEAVGIAAGVGNLPPWVIADQPGGESNAILGFQPLTAPADVRSDREAAVEAEQAAASLVPLGVTGVLSPSLDVASRRGRAVGELAYSEDPRHVARYARAVVGAYRDARMLSVASHFPGLGSGSEDTRYGPSRVGSSLEELRDRDLVPFRAAIAAGVPAVLVGNGLYVTDDFVTPASLSKAIITGLLRGELGFKGVAMTDDLADPGVTALATIPDAAVQAVLAGADMVFISGPPNEQQAAYQAVLQAVRSGRIEAGRLDAAVARVIGVKRDYGLIE